MGAFFSAIKMLAGKQRKRKYKNREPEKERETNRKRKIAGRHFGVINAISISLSKYGATFDYIASLFDEMLNNDMPSPPHQPESIGGSNLNISNLLCTHIG